MAVAAALDDPRFAPVTREELGSLALEISVLSEPTRLPAPVDAMRVVVGRHGLMRSEEHTSELQSPCNLVCRLLLEKKKKIQNPQQSAAARRHPRPTSA